MFRKCIALCSKNCRIRKICMHVVLYRLVHFTNNGCVIRLILRIFFLKHKCIIISIIRTPPLSIQVNILF
jgi:hypothetical protein